MKDISTLTDHSNFNSTPYSYLIFGEPFSASTSALERRYFGGLRVIAGHLDLDNLDKEIYNLSYIPWKGCTPLHVPEQMADGLSRARFVVGILMLNGLKIDEEILTKNILPNLPLCQKQQLNLRAFIADTERYLNSKIQAVHGVVPIFLLNMLVAIKTIKANPELVPPPQVAPENPVRDIAKAKRLDKALVALAGRRATKLAADVQALSYLFWVGYPALNVPAWGKNDAYRAMYLMTVLLLQGVKIDETVLDKIILPKVTYRINSNERIKTKDLLTLRNNLLNFLDAATANDPTYSKIGEQVKEIFELVKKHPELIPLSEVATIDHKQRPKLVS